MNNNEWISKRAYRSVNQLQPWGSNPRLAGELESLSTTEYIEDLTSEKSNLEKFKVLIKSIAERGFLPFDPVVTVKNTDGKLEVVEGNRRVLALKILINPDLAPSYLRSYVKSKTTPNLVSEIKKIPVIIAPSFEDVEWFIGQRNSTMSTINPWTRQQQFKWMHQLYSKYGGDMAELKRATHQTEGQIHEYLRVLKLLDLSNDPTVQKLFKKADSDYVFSREFPITVFERFIQKVKVREAWGIEKTDDQFEIVSNLESFKIAFAALIDGIRSDDINTRNTDIDHLDKLLKSLPKVTFESTDNSTESADGNSTSTNGPDNTNKSDGTPVDDNTDSPPDNDTRNSGRNSGPTRKNPNRRQLVEKYLTLNTSNYRMETLFDELQKVPIYSYPQHVAIAFRVFLDLCVQDCIIANNYEQKKGNGGNTVESLSLSQKIGWLKKNHFNSKAKERVDRILQTNNEFSIETLNWIIHLSDSEYIDRKFLCRMWDFYIPIFKELVELREVS